MPDPASSKVERAEQHLGEFNAACAEFVGEKPYKVRRESKDERRQSIQLSPAPPHLGLVFGDFVHNLRSALDHMVYKLVSMNALNLPRKEITAYRRYCSFPICLNPDDWEENPERFDGGLDKVRGVAPEGVAAIKSLQPFEDRTYPDSNYHPLALLSRLDNRDKHRQLITAVTDVLFVQGETAPGKYWITPVLRTRKHLADPRFVLPRVGVEAQASLAVLLAEGGSNDRALLWAPKIKPGFEPLFVTRGTLLPEWLLVGVRDCIQALEPFF